MRKFLLPAVAVAVLAGLWWWLKPVSGAPTEPQTRHYRLSFVDGQYQGPETLTAYQGDTVQLDVFSDQDDAMHVPRLRETPCAALWCHRCFALYRRE